MKSENVLLIGLKHAVAAISKRDGKILWSTKLPSGLGDSFVTLLTDEDRLFAHTQGQLHCLDLDSGRILWSNPLTGYGYRIASLCFPGGGSAPETSVAAQIQAEKKRESSD